MRELGQAELGVVGDDAEVAEKGALERTADAPALDRTHHRHLRWDEVPLGGREPAGDVVVVALARRAIAELLDVAAGGERAALGAPDDAVHLVVPPDLVERGPQRRVERVRHRVEAVGAIDGEDRDVAVVLHVHRAVAGVTHHFPLSARRAGPRGPRFAARRDTRLAGAPLTEPPDPSRRQLANHSRAALSPRSLARRRRSRRPSAPRHTARRSRRRSAGSRCRR